MIKLDMSLTQDRLPIRDAVRVLTAVGAEVERSGAVLLAEGIETEADLRRAQGMGATLGQGWYFGRPDALPESSPDQGTVSVPRRSPTSPSNQSPFERIAGARRLRSADKRTLLTLSRQLEVEAGALGGESVVISTFQDAAFFCQATQTLYEQLAEDAAMVCAIGFGMAAAPARGVRGASLAADDPLRGEWDVVVVGPHFAGALVARNVGGGGREAEQRFEYFVTYDRKLVIEAADSLLRHVVRNG